MILCNVIKAVAGSTQLFRGRMVAPARAAKLGATLLSCRQAWRAVFFTAVSEVYYMCIFLALAANCLIAAAHSAWSY